MLKYLYILILSILLLCCGPTHFQYTRFPENNELLPRIIPVYVDANFGNEDRIHIEDSVMRWNYVFNGHIILKIVSFQSTFSNEEKINVFSTHGLMIHKTDSKYPNIPDPKNPKLVTIAWTNMINGHEIFLIRDRLATKDIFPVMLHELGHYFGAEHKKEPGLMNEQYSESNYQCIDLNTVRQVAKFNKLNVLDLNYCVYVSY